MTAFARPVLAVLCGALLGFGAWGEGRVPILALLLPAALMLCATRLHAFLLAAGYVAALLRHTPEFIGTWFGNNLVIGSAAVASYAIISGGVWCVGWSRASTPVHRRALAMALAWLLALAPPLTLAVPGHPLVAVGYVLPGWGWIGVVIALGLAAAVAAGVPSLRARSRFGAIAALAAVGALAGALLTAQQRDVPGARGILAVTTTWGHIAGVDEALARIERMGRARVESRAVAVIWPESILGRYEPHLYPVMELELLNDARRAGRVHIIGMDVPMRGNRLLNAAVAFYPDGSSATAVARQPAPGSLWRPWQSTDTFVADWRHHNVLNLGQGDRAAILFCYEEYLPLLYLLNEAFDRPTVYVAMRNTWAAPHAASAAIQSWHSRGMARLFGRPYLQADNRPRPSGAGDWTPSIAP